MKTRPCSRRAFLRMGATALATSSFLSPSRVTAEIRSKAKVAIVRCRAYGEQAHQALGKAFDLIGGIGSLVRNKTVTVKLNLTGTNFAHYLGRPSGETFMSHYDTVLSLATHFFAAGARRVRLVESTQSRSGLEASLALADWDINALKALGRVEFENTRNLGSYKTYAHVKVPDGGRMFGALDLNRAYVDTDILVSLSKLKQHLTAGVTLGMKNMFGLTPNALYGAKAGDENATAGRDPIHSPFGFDRLQMPGLKEKPLPAEPYERVPRTIVDICGACPVHLSVIDGITSMSGGEGPWCGRASRLQATSPGVLAVGFNPVSTDAVGTALMGYDDPRVARGAKPFHFCENHLLLAEQAGLGVADLGQIEMVGVPLKEARVRYPDLAV